jgi:hypothetical protein
VGVFKLMVGFVKTDVKYFGLLKLLVKVFINYNPDEGKTIMVNEMVVPLLDNALETNNLLITYQVTTDFLTIAYNHPR